MNNTSNSTAQRMLQVCHMMGSIERKTLFTVHSRDSFIFDPHHSIYEAKGEHEPDPLPDSEDPAENGTPAPDIPPTTFLRITTDHWPRDPFLGFTFGCDATVCDVLLDSDQHRGTSMKQFSIVPNMMVPGTFYVKNHSQHGTKIMVGTALHHVKSMRPIAHDNEVHVFFQAFEVQLRVPNHEPHWDAFRQCWVEFISKFASAPPDLRHLDLGSLLRTSQPGSKPSKHSRKDKIGRGRSGSSVFLEVDRKTEATYAVKYFVASTSRRRIEERAKTLLNFSHKHIVQFIEFLPHPKALVMQFVGCNLQEEQAKKKLTADETRDVLHQLLQALNYIHQQSNIHGDLTPSAVLVQSRKPLYVRLGGFGDPDSYLPIYASPERCFGPSFSRRTDIWSLGIVALQYSYGIPEYGRIGKEGWYDALASRLKECPNSSLTTELRKWLCPSPDGRHSARQCLSRSTYFKVPAKVVPERDLSNNLPDTSPFREPNNEPDKAPPGDESTSSLPDTAPPEHEPSQHRLVIDFESGDD
ncbi:Putative protein kinase [Colletotrichum destructivum]|uniref:non-specific serine/threonine protein kinase n=1 Tax=Colletotrichum destructivum TaxID=34406 RepID=A0AAX4J1M7_9PEZI|nr:Putative protein kinase [Colletotrichum destructivum]